MNKGIGTPAIVALVAILLAVLGTVYYNARPEAELNVEKGKEIMAEGEKLMHDGEEMMKEGDAMMGDDETIPEDIKTTSTESSLQKGVYEPYAAEKLARAETGDVVLFFRASWCPTCRSLDADIKNYSENIPDGVSILDVNYDTSYELKKKYGVTRQHTLVQVDAKGNLIKKWDSSPTLASLVTNIQ